LSFLSDILKLIIIVFVSFVMRKYYKQHRKLTSFVMFIHKINKVWFEFISGLTNAHFTTKKNKKADLSLTNPSECNVSATASDARFI